ncbi:MAG: hypothetical protein J7J93_01290 [Candidatus Aenigmarchaeota archaeon]|nr:hypothetical protein [Candidatus Aenigmarchaeota archaeon]
MKKIFYQNLKIFIFMLLGAVLTYLIGINTNAIFAAALIGIIFGLIFPKYAIQAYIGAFIGMSSVEILPSLLFLTGACIVSSLIWIIFSKKLPNFGGKAGFIAFLGVLIINLPLIHEKELAIPINIEIEMILGVIFTAIISIKATFYLRKKFKDKIKSDAVLGSAVVGLLFGLTRIFFPQTTIFSEVAFASSFAGMTSFKFVRKKSYKLLIGLIVGIIFLFSSSFFQGFGGKLGTIAFISIIIFFLLKSKK